MAYNGAKGETQAAMANVLEFGDTSVGPTSMINRPFLFAIRESETVTIVFIGKVAAL